MLNWMSPVAKMQQLEVREEAAGDAPAVRQVLEAAFGRPDEADLVDALRQNTSVWEPGVGFVALDTEENVIGYALLTRCWVDSWPALALAPVAVTPQSQGQGVGQAVTAAALNAAREQVQRHNAPCGVIVLGEPRFYERFGFETARSWGIRAPFEVPHTHFMALNLNENFELPPGTVVYPPEFGIEDADEQ